MDVIDYAGKCYINLFKLWFEGFLERVVSIIKYELLLEKSLLVCRFTLGFNVVYLWPYFPVKANILVARQFISQSLGRLVKNSSAAYPSRRTLAHPQYQFHVYTTSEHIQVWPDSVTAANINFSDGLINFSRQRWTSAHGT